MRSLLALAALALVLGSTSMIGCSTPTRKRADKPLVPTMEDEAPKAQKDAQFEDVRKAAAEQLECPLEQVNVICLRRDTDGECVSVRADGCDKTFEYQFGDT